MNHQVHSTTGESPYRVVFKQKMRMQRLSFADRATAIPEDEDEELDGSEPDASDRECGNDSESLADGRECDSEQSNSAPTGRPIPPPCLSSIYIDSDGPDDSESARSQDSDLGLDDEIRTMFISVRQKTEKARNNMAQRYNSSSSVHKFNIGDLVSLHIDAKYRKSTTPAKLFCKVIRKPLPDMHELQCVNGVFSSKYRTTDLYNYLQQSTCRLETIQRGLH